MELLTQNSKKMSVNNKETDKKEEKEEPGSGDIIISTPTHSFISTIMQANITKFMLFLKACACSLLSFILPTIFLLKDWGIVDLLQGLAVKYAGGM